MVRVMPEQRMSRAPGLLARAAQYTVLPNARGVHLYFTSTPDIPCFLQPSPGNTAHATVPRTSNLYGECVSDSPRVHNALHSPDQQ